MNDFLSAAGTPRDGDLPNLTSEQLDQLVSHITEVGRNTEVSHITEVGHFTESEVLAGERDSVSKTNSARDQHVPSLTNRRRNVKRGAGVLVALLTAAVLAIITVYANLADQAADGIDESSIGLNLQTVPATNAAVDSAVPDAEKSATPAAPLTAENILLVGSDSREGANGAYAAAELDAEVGATNTDTMMVLHLSADREHTSVLSLPRDLWVDTVPCLAYDPATDSYGDPVGAEYTRMHLNSFYGVGGPQCLVDAVEQLTQLQITRYIEIDFVGFAAMVDALGGVTVTACSPIIDDQLGVVLADAGEQRIDGAQALNVTRARKVAGDSGSDLSRIHRQQLLLSAILREVTAAGTLLDPGELSAFIEAFTAHTRTSGLNYEDLLGMAESLGEVDPASVAFLTLPTVLDQAADSPGSLLIDHSAADPLLESLRVDRPLTADVPATPVEGSSAATEPPVPSAGNAPPTASADGNDQVNTPDTPVLTAATPDCLS